MGGGYGLAALSGLGQAFPKLAEGMIAGQKLDQHQQQLDELSAYRKDQNEARYTDIAPLFAAMKLPLPAGLTSTKSATPAADLLLKSAGAQQQREQQRTENASLADFLTRDAGGGVTSQTTGPVAEGEAGLLGNQPSMTTATPPDTRRLAAGQYLRGLSTPAPEKLMEFLFPNQKPMVVGNDASVYTPGQGFVQGPGGGKPKIELRPGANDTYAIPIDRVTGEPGAPTPVGIGSPESKGVYGRVDVENQVKLEEQADVQAGKPAWTPLMRQRRYNDLARQIMVPQGGVAVGAGSGLGAGGGTTPGGGPLVERPPSATDATHYVNKTTLQPPPPGATLSQIQQSGQYVQVAPQSLPGVKQLNTVKTMLDKADSIIASRPDLFPPSSGNVLMDNLKVAQAKAKFLAGKNTDPDVRELYSLQAGLPSVVKAFGDTANVAVAEREITQHAMGLGAATREAAESSTRTIRDMADAGAQALGFPGLLKRQQGQPAQGAPQGARTLRIRDPKTGRTGTMTLGPGEQPPAGLEILPTNGVRG